MARHIDHLIKVMIVFWLIVCDYLAKYMLVNPDNSHSWRLKGNFCKDGQDYDGSGINLMLIITESDGKEIILKKSIVKREYLLLTALLYFM